MSVWDYPVRVAGISRRVQSVDEISNEIRCEREPDNPADPNAVAVFSVSAEGAKHIGYLPKEIALKIPDEALPCSGTVEWKGQREGESVGVRINI